MTDNKPKNPDNIRFSKSTKDPENTVVWTPYNYRSAQAAIKEAGGTFIKNKDEPGGIWVVKGMTDAQEQAIRAGAQEDIALGQEGRKAREDVRKGAIESEKADKAAAKSPEETEADKAARAEAAKARAAERDKSRVLVEAGTIGIGDTVEKDGVKHEVNHIGDTYEKDGKQVANAYFGPVGAELAAKAAEKAAAAEAKDEDPSPM
jgi:hypothetical protein